jgi:hypothetical protein
MRVQFEYGLLPGITITFLKDANGPFARAVYLDELIVAGFVQPVKDVLAEFVPLYCNSRNDHSYLQQAKTDSVAA